MTQRFNPAASADLSLQQGGEDRKSPWTNIIILMLLRRILAESSSAKNEPP